MICQLNNVSKWFKSEADWPWASAQPIKALDRINLSLRPNETLTVVGESGCGKTTLGRIIAHLYRPDRGEVYFEGKNIHTMNRADYRRYRQAVQVVFQDPYSSLDPRWNVRRILNEAFTLSDARNENNEFQQITSLLSAVGLTVDVLNRFPHEFSGGERQRLAIARALLCQPKLLILDEAVSSLDVLIQEQILDLLAQLKSRFSLTYFFISHNLRVTARISDRIAVMFQGAIVEIGPTRNVLKTPLHPYTQELLAAAMNYESNDAKRLWQLPKDFEGKFHEQEHWVMNVEKKETL